MLSSVAERVYWLARYLERAENLALLFNAYSAMLFDLPRGSNVNWGTLIDITGCNDNFEGNSEEADEIKVTRFLITDESNHASIFASLNLARENARTSREVIPAEVWEQINNLYLTLKENKVSRMSRSARQDLLETVIAGCQRISAILSGYMSHNTAYAFIQIGKRLERADMTTRLVDVGSIILLPAFYAKNKEANTLIEPYQNVVWMTVLRCLSAYQAYRQHVHNRVNGERVVGFLLQDEEFPRSIGFCLNELSSLLEKLPNSDEVLRAVGRVKRVSNEVNIAGMLERGLLDYVDELQISIADIHDSISDTWFSPTYDEAVS